MDTPILGDCDIQKILPLILNLTLHDDTLLLLNNLYEVITLYLVVSIKQDFSTILPYLLQVDPTTTLFDLIVPPEISPSFLL